MSDAFYVYYDTSSLSIKHISGSKFNEEGCECIEISSELGMKFMLGMENPSNWAISKKDGKPFLSEKEKAIVSRVQSEFPLLEVKHSGEDGDIRIRLDSGILIEYDEVVTHSTPPVKLYLTDKDDPSRLLKALTLNSPGPIKLDDIKDPAIYIVSGHITATISYE